MRARLESLASVEAFSDLSGDELQQLDSRLELVPIERGQILVRQGDGADALYIVTSGRFAVMRDGQSGPVAEIGAGLPIGEIAFFAGGTRTANVVAVRDSLVLRLSRDEFEALALATPQIWRSVTATLARRLATTTASLAQAPVQGRPRTFCLLPADGGPIPSDVVAQLRAVFERHGSALFLDAAAVAEHLGPTADETKWFNAQEGRYDAVIYIADAALSAWSQKAIRQADVVVCIGRADYAGAAIPHPVTPLESLAVSLHPPDHMRLVLLHDRSGPFRGTRAWLDARPWCAMHHHIVVGQTADYERLVRFLTGRALGLVACGGGAFSIAHIGLFQAFQEAGLAFDMMGGTSGGAAMTAAFALGATPDEIEAHARDIFVTQKALKRWTLPRYSLFDPAVFDAAFREHFTDIDIADLPIPYFAISTNLSLNAVHCHRTGPLWRAVRASSTIPALLPPAYADNGDMLVDGCLLENVPIRSMHRLKAGPNVVIDFQVPGAHRFVAGSAPLPTRGQLLLASLTARGRARLPLLPGPHVVLLRSLMLRDRDVRAELGPDDRLFEPPMPDTISHLDWHKHAALRQHGYAYAKRALAQLGALGPQPVATHSPAASPLL